MNPPPIAPEEELLLRGAAAELWEMTWGLPNAIDIDSRKAFIEGHYYGLAMGVLGNRETHKYYRRKLLKQTKAPWLMLGLGLAIGVSIGLLM